MKTIITLLSFFFVVMLLESTECTMYMKHGQYLEPGKCLIKIIISNFHNYFN